MYIGHFTIKLPLNTFCCPSKTTPNDLNWAFLYCIVSLLSAHTHCIRYTSRATLYMDLCNLFAPLRNTTVQFYFYLFIFIKRVMLTREETQTGLNRSLPKGNNISVPKDFIPII